MSKLHSILLVDDDAVTNFLNEDLLRQMKIADSIYTTRNGAEALSFLTKNCAKKHPRECPDLVLLDISMPVMDGFEFLEEFEKMDGFEKNIHVVILSSSDDEKDIKRAKGYKISGYICKPLTEKKLLELLK
ncbi:MAG TPA: response regulator [Chitinophagales bacterium]|nr:response regulator [Chitinophagales bacterium]